MDLTVSRNDVRSPVLPAAVTEIMASACNVLATSTSRHVEMEESFKPALQHYGSAVSPQLVKYFPNSCFGDQAKNAAKPGGLCVESSLTDLVKLTCTGRKNLIQKVDGSFSLKKDGVAGKRQQHTRDTGNTRGGFSDKNRPTSEAVMRNGVSQSPKDSDVSVPKSPGNQRLSAGDRSNGEFYSSTSTAHERSDFSTQNSVRHELQSSSTLERWSSPVQERLRSPTQERQRGPIAQDRQTPASAHSQQPSPSQERQRPPVPQEQRSPSSDQKQSSPEQENRSFQSSTQHKDCPSTQSRTTGSPTSDADRISGRSQDGSPAPPNDAKSRYIRLLAENRWLKRRQLCRLCQTKAANITLLPCGHLVYCEDCAPTLSHCGVCRRQILADVKTFLC